MAGFSLNKISTYSFLILEKSCRGKQFRFGLPTAFSSYILGTKILPKGKTYLKALGKSNCFLQNIYVKKVNHLFLKF